jgi:hypothetical protein
LVGSSPSIVEQFSFEYCPLSHETTSRIHHLLCFGKLACCPTPVFRLCALPNPCLVLVQLFWEVGFSPNSCSQLLLLFPHLVSESSALRVLLLAQTQFSGAGSEFYPHLCCWF